jgi:hypothetical protein
MTDDVDAFLARCEDVLTDWQASGDSMHAIGYDVLDVDPQIERLAYLDNIPVAPPYHLRIDSTPLYHLRFDSTPPYHLRFDSTRLLDVADTAPAGRDVLAERVAHLDNIPVAPVVEFDGRAFAEVLQAAFGDMAAAFRPLLNACRHIGVAIAGIVPAVDPLPTPDPRERALYMRRNRNTGPHTHRLNGRRR